MALKVNIKIKDLDKIKEAFSKAPETVVREINGAIEKSVYSILASAFKEAPVNKQSGGGNLRQMLRGFMVNRLSGIVESGALYSVYVHEGTRPHIIVPVNKKVLANKRTGEFFGKKVNHPGTKANPYMVRAVQNSKDDIERYFVQAVTNIFSNFPR